MPTTRNQILHRIRQEHGGDGAVVTPKDFLDLAGRDAVDQALRRLVRAGQLVRLGRGLYHLPRTNPTLGITVPPDPDKVADALGRQTGSTVAPSPAAIANRLGLSTQIPAKPTYLTTGRSRTVRVGGHLYRFKHTPPHKLPEPDTAVGRVLQAIQTLGPNPDPADLDRLRRHLPPKDRARFRRKARYLSNKTADVARQLLSPAETRSGATGRG
jgi:hypothetical protein